MQIRKTNPEFRQESKLFVPEQNMSQLEVVSATFYMHQTSGACADKCACDLTQQIEMTEG